jgi:hypothetical protein
MNYLFTSGGLQQVRCELEIRLFHIIPQLSFSPVSYVLIRLARTESGMTICLGHGFT